MIRVVDLSGSTWLWPLLSAPFAGSFIGVLIRRLPRDRPVVVARSCCEECGARLSAIDLVPLVSFLLLRGRCRHCRAPIKLFHPMVELAASAVALWAVLAEPVSGWVWIDCGVGWTLLTLGWIDWNTYLLPDVLTLPLLLAGLALTLLMDPEVLTDHCLAACFGYLSLAAIALAYRRLSGREGLGSGDAKLLAAAGAWCGLAALPFIILCSAVIGLLVIGSMAVAGQAVTGTTKLPFGPCIALAFWLAWIHGTLLAGIIEMLGGG